jgi:hypothetical protein
MHATASPVAQVPWSHHEASVWLPPLGHGKQTGAQSSGLVQAAPAAPDFQARYPTTDAQVVSTFSPMLSTELASVAIVGVPVRVAAGGNGASLFPQAAPKDPRPRIHAHSIRMGPL